MGIGQTVLIRRLIMSALRPLTGTRATATATVKLAEGVTEQVKLPLGCFAYPIHESAAGVADVDDQLLLRTAAEVYIQPGPAGTVVPISSVLGGARYNAFKAGARLIWDPPVAGLETHSVLATDLAGGLDPGAGHQAPIHDVATYEELTATDAALDLFLARLANRVPCVVIAWDSSDEATAKGRNHHHTPERWDLYVIIENHQGEKAKRDEGLNICDAVRGLLVDKSVVDGLPFSDPPARVFGRRRFRTTTTSIVYVLEVDTFTTAKRIDLRDPEQLPPGWTTDELAFPDWESTRYRLETCDDPPVAIVDGAVYPHPVDAYDDGHDEGHA